MSSNPESPTSCKKMYRATLEELKLIDEALDEIARGEIATDEEVEAVFAKYRRT